MKKVITIVASCIFIFIGSPLYGAGSPGTTTYIPAGNEPPVTDVEKSTTVGAYECASIEWIAEGTYRYPRKMKVIISDGGKMAKAWMSPVQLVQSGGKQEGVRTETYDVGFRRYKDQVRVSFGQWEFIQAPNGDLESSDGTLIKSK